MFKAMAAALVVAGGLAGSAWAAGPIHVDTPFPTGVSNVDDYKDELAGIGVTVELASPTFITVGAPTVLNFRLLESHASPRGAQVTTLVVDGVDYNFGTQAFAAPGTFLGSQLFQGSFTDLVGFRDAEMPADVDPIGWPEAFQVYIRGVDEPNLSGIGPFIGNFETVYFSIGGLALVEVSAAPEPATWALMIAGFGLAGARLRRARAPTATAA